MNPSSKFIMSPQSTTQIARTYANEQGVGGYVRKIQVSADFSIVPHRCLLS
jgi:hypothetical protein